MVTQRRYSQHETKGFQCLAIKQLMNLPSNKKCADCGAQNPVIINIAFRTFICKQCASIHLMLFKEYKKLNLIDSVRFAPTSSFSEEEISRMRHTNAGNQAVNATYLASYDCSNPKNHIHPNSSSEFKLRKSFIWFKYVKKEWFRDHCADTFATVRNCKGMEKPLPISNQNEFIISNRNNQKNEKAIINNNGTKIKVINNEGQIELNDQKQALKHPNDSSYVKPHDIILKLMRLPPNKRCADCATKCPAFISFTHRAFICGKCAVSHIRLDHKVIEVGKHNFSAIDILRMRHVDAGNDSVNSRFLAKYNPSKESLTPPNQGSSERYRMSWILKKYEMKLWCQESLNSIDEDIIFACPKQNSGLQSLRKSLQHSGSKRLILDEDNEENPLFFSGSKRSVLCEGSERETFTSYPSNYRRSQRSVVESTCTSYALRYDDPSVASSALYSGLSSSQANSVSYFVQLNEKNYDSDSTTSDMASSLVSNSTHRLSVESQPVIKRKNGKVSKLRKKITTRSDKKFLPRIARTRLPTTVNASCA